MIEERYELALDRIRLMQTEDTVGEPYRDYFKKMAEFVLMLDELRTELLDGRYQKLELDELRKWKRIGTDSGNVICGTSWGSRLCF